MEDRMHHRYRKNPHLGVAIATEESNLFVLDLDVKSNGMDSIEALEDEFGKLPDTLISHTGGGRHHFFVRPEGGIKSSAGKIAQGIDVCCNSGYVVAPPSLNETGKV